MFVATDRCTEYTALSMGCIARLALLCTPRLGATWALMPLANGHSAGACRSPLRPVASPANGEAAAPLPACPAQLPRATSQPAASGHTSYRKATGRAGKPCSVRHRWHALVGMSWQLMAVAASWGRFATAGECVLDAA